MAPQVTTPETIEFMRKPDVKEIHGYNAAEGLTCPRRGTRRNIGSP
jgi:arginine decarboxylase